MQQYQQDLQPVNQPDVPVSIATVPPPLPRQSRPTRRYGRLALLGLLSCLFFIATGFVAYNLTQSTSADVGRASGLNWYSGVHAANELGPHIQFGNWRGRPIDMVHTFTKRDSWAGIIEAEPYLTDHKPFYDNKDHLYVISQPLYPEGQGNQVDCAAGDYDDEWRGFGDVLGEHGLNHHNTVIRLAWEFNGNFTDWRPTVPDNPTAQQISSSLVTWKQCWRNVAKAIKATAPSVRTDWTLVGHDSLARGPNSPQFRQYNPYDAYPGNDVVDIVGIDDYDMHPPAKTDAEFDARCNRSRAGGTCDLAKFARKNGKQLAVGEWGVVANCSLAAETNRHGGDNALYVRRMAQLFNENRDILAYEGYYDDPFPGNVCSTLYRDNTDGSSNTKAKREYLKWFGQKSPFGVGGAAAIGQPTYQNKLLFRPDGRMYYVRDGRAGYIGNSPQANCVKVRRGAGEPQPKSSALMDTYAPGDQAYCYYEQERDLNFVREDGTNPVWLVQPGGTKLHVGVLCVPDPYTTPLKKFRVHIVPFGETAAHRQVGAFIGNPQKCGQLPI